MSSIFSQDVKQRKHVSSARVRAEISGRPISECGFFFTSVWNCLQEKLDLGQSDH